MTNRIRRSPERSMRQLVDLMLDFPFRWQQPWAPTSESIFAWDNAFHELMLGDRLRMDAYRRAIFDVIRPGDVVVDLGVGSGVLSEWALRAGASRVVGIEMNAAMLECAVARLEQAGFADRFDPVNDISFNVGLRRKADVLISEIIGNMGDNENIQPILEDAVQRLLIPGGRQIPLEVQSFMAPVHAPDAHSAVAAGDIASLAAGYDVQEILKGRKTRSRFDLYYDCVLPERLRLAEAQPVAFYGGAWEQSPYYSRALSFRMEAPGLLTGFKMYFVARLSGDTVLDISGDDIEAGTVSDSWKHAYLPIESPIKCERGDRVEVRFERRPAAVKKSFSEVYAWQGRVVRGLRVAAGFAQCTQ